MKKLVYNFLYYLGIPTLLRRAKKDTITVLSLHRVSNESDYFFEPLNPATFEKMLQYCCKHYTIISFNEINSTTLKPKLILSFDDGYYDFVEIALPILKKMGLPSNHNVVNACLNNNETIWTQKVNDIFNYLKKNGITSNTEVEKFTKYNGDWKRYYTSFFNVMLNTTQDERNKIINAILNQYNIEPKYKMMNWDDLTYCKNNKVEIGCHTYNHDSLISIKDKSYFNVEILQSIQEISKNINREITTIALPNGQYNESVIDFIKATEIVNLLLLDDKINVCVNNNSFKLISRVGIGNESIYETILRIELFHPKIKKIYGKLFHS